MKNCEHNDLTPSRCRRRAINAIGYKRPFGYRIGPKGETPEYIMAVTLRCADHSTVKGEVGRLPIGKYLEQIRVVSEQ